MPHSSGRGRGFQMITTVLGGQRRLARMVLVDSSAAAERRLEVMRWYEAHGRNARLTSRHFGFSPDTISRWVRAFQARGVRGLEDRSRRPHRVRTPTTPLRVVERVRQLREKYPRWGREKLSVLLAREGIFVSGKTVDRVLERLRRSGELREPRVVQKSLGRRRERMKRLARPSGLIVDRPGFLQLDTQDIRGDGRRAFTFAAVDHLTRKRILGAAARITSEAGALFFDRAVREFPSRSGPSRPTAARSSRAPSPQPRRPPASRTT